MTIDDYNELKITSVKHNGGVVHFKYKGEDYTLLNGGREWTSVISLYKGRNKGHLKHISSEYGLIYSLIKYKNNKKVLKYIDKENFVLSLIKFRILKPTPSQEIKLLVDDTVKDIEKMIFEMTQLKKKIESKYNNTNS